MLLKVLLLEANQKNLVLPSKNLVFFFFLYMKRGLNLIYYRQFFFLFANVLLFITVASTLFKSQKDIFEDPTKIANIFASKLPEVAPFYINYTVLQGIML